MGNVLIISTSSLEEIEKLKDKEIDFKKKDSHIMWECNGQEGNIVTKIDMIKEIKNPEDYLKDIKEIPKNTKLVVSGEPFLTKYGFGIPCKIKDDKPEIYSFGFRYIGSLKIYKDNFEVLKKKTQNLKEMPAEGFYVSEDGESFNITFEQGNSKSSVGRIVPIDSTYEKDLDYPILDIKRLKKLQKKPYLIRITKKSGALYICEFEVLKKQKVYEETKEISFEKEKERCLTFVEKKELEERILYMTNIDMDEDEIAEVLSYYEKDSEVSKPSKLYVQKKKPAGDNFLIKNILLDILDGHNILLEGPKSTGKNVAWETVAWLLNMKIAVQKISVQTTNEDVLGSMATDNTSVEKITSDAACGLVELIGQVINKEKATEEQKAKAVEFITNAAKASSTSLKFQLGILSKVLIRGRGIFIFDEMDMGSANFLSSIVNTLGDDHSQKFEIPGYGEIEIPQNVIFGATQNGSEYIGTQPQNDATMSRFTKYIMENPSSIIQILKEEKVNVNNEVLVNCDKIYAELREQVNEGLISDTCLNIRGFKRALHNVQRGCSLSKALERQIVNICTVDERDIILNIIEAAV